VPKSTSRSEGYPVLPLNAGRTPLSRRWELPVETGVAAEVQTTAGGRIPGLRERGAGPREGRTGPVAAALPHGARVLSRRPSPMCSDAAHPALWGTPAVAPPARGAAGPDDRASDHHSSRSGAQPPASASHPCSRRCPASSPPSFQKLPSGVAPRRLEAAEVLAVSTGSGQPATPESPRRPRGSSAKLETIGLGHASLPKPRTLKSLPDAIVGKAGHPSERLVLFGTDHSSESRSA
jgi:hypothetical protein